MRQEGSTVFGAVYEWFERSVICILALFLPGLRTQRVLGMADRLQVADGFALYQRKSGYVVISLSVVPARHGIPNCSSPPLMSSTQETQDRLLGGSWPNTQQEWHASRYSLIVVHCPVRAHSMSTPCSLAHEGFVGCYRVSTTTSMHLRIRSA
ncbi:hypothetical protein FKP32DRAFT_1597641 [Trametes sanguinea]|nr:hypothetical protein FKP32DRAFT_1597641 [Trametes sanguinea]